ncbi:MAG: VOC family protein [Cyanobacteria bacterium J06626_14]
MANIQGYHHVGLTVPNINQTREFFINVFKFQQIGEVPDYPACFLSDGTIMLTLWQAATPEQAIPFDRKNNIGLHHFALTVDSLDALNSFHHTLSSTEGVEIEFAPEPLGNSSTHHMMFYIPGGIRMELTAPGAK